MGIIPSRSTAERHHSDSRGLLRPPKNSLDNHIESSKSTHRRGSSKASTRGSDLPIDAEDVTHSFAADANLVGMMQSDGDNDPSPDGIVETTLPNCKQEDTEKGAPESRYGRTTVARAYLTLMRPSCRNRSSVCGGTIDRHEAAAETIKVPFRGSHATSSANPDNGSDAKRNVSNELCTPGLLPQIFLR